MNQLASVVSDSLSGKTSAAIEMNGRFYTVKPPKTKLWALMLKPLSKIYVDELDEKESDITVLSKLMKLSVEQYRYADEVIAMAILGDRYFGALSGFRMWQLKRRLSDATDEERLEALRSVIALIVPAHFFAYARLAMELTGTVAKETKQE